MQKDFNFTDEQTYPVRKYLQTDMDFLLVYFSGKINVSYLDEVSHTLFELAPSIFDIILHVWLSELPVEKEIDAFCKKVILAADIFKNKDEKRKAALNAASNRADKDTGIVLNVSGKVYHEIHRLMGLLRFAPVTSGAEYGEEYVAKCAPDHLVLPAFGQYFTARFGETAWSIIDEKRGIRLRRLPGENINISVFNNINNENSKNCTDKWSDLWKHYHKTINNEERDNPNLQRQLMPRRYWKYLNEL